MLVKVADDLVSICQWNRSHLLVQLVMVWVATKLRCPIVQFIPPKCNGFRGLQNLGSWTLFEMVQPVSNGSIAVSLQVFIMESKNCEEAPCRQMGVLHAKEPSLYMIIYLKTKVYLKKKNFGQSWVVRRCSIIQKYGMRCPDHSFPFFIYCKRYLMSYKILYAGHGVVCLVRRSRS